MTNERSIEADIAVIGAGPAGAAAAWRLAGAGRDVLVVERGDWFDYDALARDAPDWERRREGPLNANPNIRRARSDYPIDDSDTPIKPMIGNTVGGGSVWWSAHAPRFRPEDFRMLSLDGVGADWPIAYDDLAPYYALNESRIGVASHAGDPSAAPTQAPALSLPTIGAHGRRVAAALDRLGWHWWPVDLVVGRDAEAPDAQKCTHIGPCDIGCPARRRAGADHAYMRDAIDAGARLMTRTRVLRLEHDAKGRVTCAVCATDDGVLKIRASRFVLAANGLGTPRLLLLSRSAHFPDGLANRSGLVGRNLMLHPYGRMDGLFEEPLGAWTEGVKAGIVSFEFFATEPERGFLRGLKLQLTGGPPAGALAQGAVIGSALPWGAGHHAAFEKRFDHICGFTVCAEDLPERDNRVTLSNSLQDSDGAAAPKMTYRISHNSRRALDFGLAQAKAALREAGALETFATPLRAQAGFHLMGTARMGHDPATSVTDLFGGCHDCPNLFIADASLFVTSSSINPTATAQALALRLADHLIAA